MQTYHPQYSSFEERRHVWEREDHEPTREGNYPQAGKYMSLLLKFYVQKVMSKIIPERIIHQKIQRTRKNRRVH
jgi:hypothetical protein